MIEAFPAFVGEIELEPCVNEIRTYVEPLLPKDIDKMRIVVVNWELKEETHCGPE